MHNTCRREPHTLSAILCKSAATSPFYFHGHHNNHQRQHKFKRISTPKQTSQTHANGLPHTWGGHSPQPNPPPACGDEASAPSKPLGKTCQPAPQRRQLLSRPPPKPPTTPPAPTPATADRTTRQPHHHLQIPVVYHSRWECMCPCHAHTIGIFLA